jgi:hypothetical protein
MNVHLVRPDIIVQKVKKQKSVLKEHIVQLVLMSLKIVQFTHTIQMKE